MMKQYKEIGSPKVGVFGITKEVEHTQTGIQKCLKIIEKSKHESEEIAKKICNLTRIQSIKSPLILAPELIEEDEYNFYVITDIAKGVQLQKYIIKNKRLKEETAIKILYSVLKVLQEYKNFKLVYVFDN